MKERNLQPELECLSCLLRGKIVWGYTIEREEKSVYVIHVPNVIGQYVKIDKTVNNWIIMSKVMGFGFYDWEVLNQYK